MNGFAEVERILEALPKQEIGVFPAGTKVPNVRKVTPLAEYNGFDGYERNRTWNVCKWLMEHGKMLRPSKCDLCGTDASQYHAENYFDFSSYVAVCIPCHRFVHNRLRNFETWESRVQAFDKPEGHWIRLLGPSSLPVADWCAAIGQCEPTFSDFVEG